MPDDPPHQQRQQWQQKYYRQQAAPRRISRQHLAHTHILCNLNDLGSCLQREHSVCRSSQRHISKAQHRHLGQSTTQSRFENSQPFICPDLHDEFMVFILGRRSLWPAFGVYRQARAQCECCLLHLVVEQCVRLLQCIAIGKHALQHHDPKNGHADQRQQSSSQRAWQAEEAWHFDAFHGLGTI